LHVAKKVNKDTVDRTILLHSSRFYPWSYSFLDSSRGKHTLM